MPFDTSGANSNSQKLAKKRLSFGDAVAAYFTGRDAEILAQCSGDIRAETRKKLSSLLISTAFHGGAMYFVLRTLNIPSEVAMTVGALSGLGLAIVDGKTMITSDAEKMSRIVRETAPDVPKSMLGGSAWPAFGVRCGVTLVTSLFLSFGIKQTVFSDDTSDWLVAQQTGIDAEIAPLVQDQVDAELSVLKAVLEQHISAKNAIIEELDAARDEEAAQREARATFIAGLKTQLSTLRTRLANAEAEVAKHRDRMSCEEWGGDAGDCPTSSNVAGKGKDYNLAFDRHDAAEKVAEGIRGEIRAVENELAKNSTNALPTVNGSNATTIAALGDAQSKIDSARNAVANYDRNQRLTDLIENHPDREVINPTSLSNRLKAWFELRQDNMGLTMFGALLMGVGFIMESLVLIGSLLARPNDYHRKRAFIFVREARESQRELQQGFLDDAPLRRDFQDQCINENSVMRDLKEQAAQQKAERAAAAKDFIFQTVDDEAKRKKTKEEV